MDCEVHAMNNTLYYGNNLPILRDYVKDETVDLIYLDPPFNSKRTYNVLFAHEDGKEAEAQIAAFGDTWHWSEKVEAHYGTLTRDSAYHITQMIEALRSFIGTNQMMAYLVMMAVRLIELHRVLKPTGSLYLHCDPTASHYLKILLDTIFGAQGFRTEIVWKRTSAHSNTKQGAKQPGAIHDVIFFYSKSNDWVWNPQYTEYDKRYVERNYRHKDTNGRLYRADNLTAAKAGGDVSYLWHVKRQLPNGEWEADLDGDHKNPVDGYEYKGVPPYNGRYWAYSQENMRKFAIEDRLYYASSGMPNYKRYLDEMPGVHIQDLWLDIPPLSGQAAERLGYPTQKPTELLKRIIEASSNEGDVVLDPFCGCGTTISAAQQLDRKWIGIDITTLATGLIKRRLKNEFPDATYDVIGLPTTVHGARELAKQKDGRYQFEWWILDTIDARLYGAATGSKRGKKGSDGGIDGILTFQDDNSHKSKRVIVQVKSGKVNPSVIRDLVGTVQREKAAMGVLLTLEKPTPKMNTEAVSAGFYHSEGWNREYRKIQILTVEQILNGERPNVPPNIQTYQRAERVKTKNKQNTLDI